MASWEADVRNTWGSMIGTFQMIYNNIDILTTILVDAQNQIADPNNFSSYVKKMRSFEPVFVKQDHEYIFFIIYLNKRSFINLLIRAFSLMRFGKPADPRALPRLLLEDKSLITVSGIPSLMKYFFSTCHILIIF